MTHAEREREREREIKISLRYKMHITSFKVR
jgi:hypothetical protein